jgi:hypothetical protein
MLSFTRFIRLRFTQITTNTFIGRIGRVIIVVILLPVLIYLSVALVVIFALALALIIVIIYRSLVEVLSYD